MAIDLKKIKKVIDAKKAAEDAAKQKQDNTRIKKPETPTAEKVDYSYMSPFKENSAKDSADYRRGFSSAMKTVSKNDKDIFGNKYQKGPEWVGLNDNYNAGFSEGKDKTLDRKNKK